MNRPNESTAACGNQANRATRSDCSWPLQSAIHRGHARFMGKARRDCDGPCRCRVSRPLSWHCSPFDSQGGGGDDHGWSCQLDGSDLALLKACKAEIEGVESMSPQQVFEIVREALRAVQVKQIDCPKKDCLTVRLSRVRNEGIYPTSWEYRQSTFFGQLNSGGRD